MAERLGVSTWSLQQWVQAYRASLLPGEKPSQDAAAENALRIACGKHRVRSQTSYRRRPSPRRGRLSVVPPNRLQQQFNVDEPNRAWVTDITYIRTHDGWPYLTVVIDLFFRPMIGWSMQSRISSASWCSMRS